MGTEEADFRMTFVDNPRRFLTGEGKGAGVQAEQPWFQQGRGLPEAEKPGFAGLQSPCAPDTGSSLDFCGTNLSLGSHTWLIFGLLPAQCPTDEDLGIP